MKNIKDYKDKKYSDKKYKEVEDGIYELTDNLSKKYVTSLSFIQEPDLGEGKNAYYITQYPLDDVLEEYEVEISDFYDILNTENSEVCYREFSSVKLDSIKKLRSIIGKHVYSKVFRGKFKLVIE